MARDPQQQKPEQPRTKKVSVNLPVAVVDQIDAAAAAAHRDRTGELLVLLEDALARRRKAS